MRQKNPELDLFENRSPKSRQFSKDSSQFLPGGDSRNTSYYAPYPLIFTHGEGSYIYDLDEIKRLDFANNFTSVVLPAPDGDDKIIIEPSFVDDI